MITIKNGDIFQSKMECLVNPVNCVGVMGAGLAKEFKDRYSGMFERYKAACDNKMLKVGFPYLLHGEPNILLFPTKDHWHSKSNTKYINDGLDYFMAMYVSGWHLSFQSIAFPALGCGLGGLDWVEIVSLMVKKLVTVPLDVEIYAPVRIIR